MSKHAVLKLNLDMFSYWGGPSIVIELLFVYLLLYTIIINLATYWSLYLSTAQFYKLLIDSMISNYKYQFCLICNLDYILMLS